LGEASAWGPECCSSRAASGPDCAILRSGRSRDIWPARRCGEGLDPR